jgi:hypothetical protein
MRFACRLDLTKDQILAEQKYIQLLAKQLVLAHGSSCPWRVVSVISLGVQSAARL